MQETHEVWIQSLGQEEPLEDAMALRILAWRISRTEDSGGLWFMGHKELDTTEVTLLLLFVE